MLAVELHKLGLEVGVAVCTRAIENTEQVIDQFFDAYIAPIFLSFMFCFAPASGHATNRKWVHRS